MTQFNDQDFELLETSFKNKDVFYFNHFKNRAVERLKYLKPLLDEIKAKEMDLNKICSELNLEVTQLNEIIQKEI